MPLHMAAVEVMVPAEVIITMEQAVVDPAGGKYTVATPRIHSPSTQVYQVLLGLQLPSDFLDSPRFHTHENVPGNNKLLALCTQTSISLCVSLSFPLSRTDSLRCSFNLVCLVAPAHHEDYTAYLTFVVCVSIVSVRYVYS